MQKYPQRCLWYLKQFRTIANSCFIEKIFCWESLVELSLWSDISTVTTLCEIQGLMDGSVGIMTGTVVYNSCWTRAVCFYC